jgi:hypothetical protein
VHVFVVYIFWISQEINTHRIIPNRKYNKVFPDHAMRTYRGSRVIAPLILGTRWRWVVNFKSLSALHPDNNYSTHWKGGWVGPRACLDVLEKWKVCHLIPGFESRTVQPVASSFTVYTTPAPNGMHNCTCKYIISLYRIYRVLLLVYCLYCFCIISFMYIYSYLFCLYSCKDYCHRVTTQLQ